jgi:site-specific DNA-methyltransferase (adenine-specific)
MITITNEDNMLLMARYPDNYFDLAIVDPPYGINAEQGTNRKSRKQFADKKSGWDSFAPDDSYFKELLRVSKNQVIWGANHFIEKIPNANSKSWLVWDKKKPR